MTRSRDLADSADKDITGTLTVDAAIVQGDIAVTGTVDGIDIATRDAILTSTTTTAGAALPKAGGALTGAVTTNSTFDGVDIATRDAVLTSTTTTANAALPKAGGAVTGNVTFGNNNKAVFGTGSSLEIYGDGSHSFIKDTGQGDLYIRGSNNIRLQSNSGETYLIGELNGAVYLRHDDVNKLATSATGVTVTGAATLSSGQLAFAGSISDPNGAAYIWRPADNTLAFGTANEERMRISSVGNIGIGTSSPASALHIDAPDNGAIVAIFDTDNSASKLIFRNTSTTGNNTQIGAVGNDFVAFTGGEEQMRITSAGNVGIGTASPTALTDQTYLSIVGTSVGGVTLQSGGSVYGNSAEIVLQGAYGKAAVIDSGTNSIISFRYATAEKMRMDSGGNLLVGKTGNFSGSRTLVAGTKSGTNGTNGMLTVLDEQGFGTTDNGGSIAFGGNFYNGGQVVFATVQGVKENNTDSNNAGALKFTTKAHGANQVEAMRISSTGDLSTAGHNNSSGGAQFVGGTSIVRAAANFNLTTAAQMVVPRSSITNLATGTYLMCIYLSGGNWYGSTVTGIVQHYGGTTNSNSSGGPNTIHLTASGHAQNSGVLYAKYQTTLGNTSGHGVMVWASTATTTQMTITFKRLK